VILSLVRDAFGEQDTFGVLVVADLTLNTIERPWIPADGHPGGENGISCVPVGTYALALHDSEAHPQTWALVNPELGVWHLPSDIPPGEAGRSAVLIHPANFAHELLGCIAPGLGRGHSDGINMVTQSRAAFAQLQHAVPWTPGHTLSISERNS
jgi:hypothetical protein